MNQNFKSEFLKELQWRGFLFQATHEQELDNLFFEAQNSGASICSYIGFDCTAASLHVGSLIQIMMLRLLQKHGHKPVALLGGGTTKIGDPSGKDEARKIIDEGQIQKNLDGIYANLAKFIQFEKSPADKIGAKFVNNDDWLKNLNYIDFLQNVGRHFSVNKMLSFDSVKLRLQRDQPLSFLEFNYMILQAYDFYVLNRNLGCVLQIGGSDQWGNIVNGVDLIRRIGAQNSDSGAKVQSFGLTSPLLTTSDGKKMGKTANGAVWLDENLLNAYDYFQYFRNVTDEDSIKFLKLFTDLEKEEIAKLEKLDGQEINKAKEILAFEATKICHGQEKAQQALTKAREIFIGGNKDAYEEKFVENLPGKKLVEIMKGVEVAKSNGEARRLIEGGGVKINDEKVEDVDFVAKTGFNLQVGKKRFFKIVG